VLGSEYAAGHDGDEFAAEGGGGGGAELAAQLCQRMVDLAMKRKFDTSKSGKSKIRSGRG